MNRQVIVDYCLGKPGAWPDSPWGEDDHVAKVGDKIFCFYGGDRLAITVKNTPEAIAEWRARYPEHIGTAAYLAKHLWNQVVLEGDGAPGEEEMRELIDDSYDLVVAKLPRSQRPGQPAG
jgi:predicted DNA-binding protein (MmcQ/YjbR family)